MRFFQHNIFLRIYAGLVVLVLLVALLMYFLVQIINQNRAQTYREDMADGVAFVMGQVLSKQPSLQSQRDWVNDVSQVLELPIDLVTRDKISLTRTEQYRLKHQQAVVRFDNKNAIADIYGTVDKMPGQYLHIRVNKLTESQIKVIPILILEDLVYYPGKEEQRLKTLQKHFAYPLSFKNLSDLKLDFDQMSRLRLDKTQTLLLYQDSSSMQGTTISAISALTNVPNRVLMLGPVPMFNWLPFRLFAGVTLFSLLLLSLGVYALIRPLEFKIRIVSHALNRVQRGEMDTRVEVVGSDDIAILGKSFNSMTSHIQRLIEAQRELTRAVSHELRTPVARIRFGMEMLTDTDDYESRVEQMAMIDEDIQSLDSLIDEILTYANLEQGTPSLKFEPIVLRDLMQQVANETKKIKHEKQVIFELPADDVIVDAELRYLHRVIQNFVGNAIRYSEHEVLVSSGIENGMAFICVEDDGAGIPEKDREKVFEAFTRLDDSRTRASGGYGLGLSIVNRVAYWFKGCAKVDSSPSLGGARFIMTWPAQRKR